MKKSDVTCLVLRVVGIYLIAIQLSYLGHSLGIFIGQSKSTLSEGFLAFVISLLSIVPGLLLIALSKLIAARIVPDSEESLPGPSLSIADWQSIGFSVIGVLLIAQAVPYLVQSISTHQAFRTSTRSNWPYLIGQLVKMSIGIALFLWSRGLAKLWQLVQRGRPLQKETR